MAKTESKGRACFSFESLVSAKAKQFMKCCRRKYTKWSTSTKITIPCSDKKIGRNRKNVYQTRELDLET